MSFLSTCIYLGLRQPLTGQIISFPYQHFIFKLKIIKINIFPYLGIFFAVALISGVEAES